MIINILRTEENPQVLFERWNQSNQSDVRCSKEGCDNHTNNAYIVKKNIMNEKKYIVPLCTQCYDEVLSYSPTKEDNFIDLGQVTIIDDNLLMEYKI